MLGLGDRRDPLLSSEFALTACTQRRSRAMTRESPTLRRLDACDAPAVVRCFERCYAGTYPSDAFHDPAELAALVNGGLLRSMIAVTPDGEVVGHMGLRLRAANAITAEAGNTVVDPDHRGDHLAARLGLALMQLGIETGLIGTHGYPTTAHPVIQKLEVEGGAIEVGILFGYIPAETHYIGLDADSTTQRLAVVVVYRSLAAAPTHRVWLPTRHEELLRSLYQRANLQRDIAGPGGPPSSTDTHLSAHYEQRRGLLRIEVRSIGSDTYERVVEGADRVATPLVIVDLPLGDPGVQHLTDTLAGAGFFFGALLPEYRADGDVLRLQRPAAEWPQPRLATEEAKRLLAYIEADRR